MPKGITKRAKELELNVADFLDENDVQSAVDTLREGLGATQMVRGGRTEGGYDYVETPDNGTRFRAAQLILAYRFGQPATRAEVTVQRKDDTLTSSDPQDILRRLKDSGVDMNSIVDTYVTTLEQIDEDSAE